MSDIIRFFNTYIPMDKCNLNCHYCYVGQVDGYNSINDWDMNLKYDIDHMRKCLKPERLGGVCLFNLCAGGETLLFKGLHEIAEMLLELGHYVSFITNATLKKPLMELLAMPQEFNERLFFKCSLQCLELKKRKLIDTFFDNIEILKQHNVSFSIEITSNDETIPYISDIKELCMERIGALPHIVESRNQEDNRIPRLTKLPLSEHQKAWGSFDSPLFIYQQHTYEKHQPKFCYAGVYGAELNLYTGDCYQCSGTAKFANLFDSPEEPIHFSAVGENCPLQHCFLSYVWASLCGCYPDDNAPLYSEERDRCCTDGSHWLTPAIREAYSHRCSEYNKPYSPDKAEFINALMRRVYSDGKIGDDEMVNISKSIGKHLHTKNYKKIAIYGMGKIGKWLVPIINKADIEISYAIDKCAHDIDNCNFPVITPNDELPKADAIIVSVYSEYTVIAPSLRNRTNIPIISIVCLAD